MLIWFQNNLSFPSNWRPIPRCHKCRRYMTPLVIERIDLLVCWQCKCQIRKEDGEGKKCERCEGDLTLATKDRKEFLELCGEVIDEAGVEREL
jgi:hypothetical protein